MKVTRIPAVNPDIIRSDLRMQDMHRDMMQDTSSATARVSLGGQTPSRYTRPNSRSYRAVWERHNGAKLPEGMVVHHIDGNPDNNKPENLQAVTVAEHGAMHGPLRAEANDRKRDWIASTFAALADPEARFFYGE